MSKILKLASFLLLLILTSASFSSAQADFDADRAKASKLYNNGNYKEAYQLYEKLILNSDNNSEKAVSDYHEAVRCISNLGNIENLDSFIEKVLLVHKDNWRILSAVAYTHFGTTSYGYLIGNKFYRGSQKSTGKYVNSYKRDRVRGLQLYEKARKIVESQDLESRHKVNFYYQYANAYAYNNSYWNPYLLTEIEELPDYDEGYGYNYHPLQGATDSKGNPIYIELPEKFEEAKNNGERWRWLLNQAAVVDPKQRNRSDYEYAVFLQTLFGVQTLQSYSWFSHRDFTGHSSNSKTEVYALDSLKDNETIAKLASGAKRFTLPDEYNFISIFKEIASNPKNSYASASADILAAIFENRRQYPKAVNYWKQSIKISDSSYKHDRLKQIVGNWGKFESNGVQPAGKYATVDFTYRNADKVKFTINKVDLKSYIKKLKKYLESSPREIKDYSLNINYLGDFFLNSKFKNLVDKREFLSWEEKLEPRKNHFNSRIKLNTKLKEPGLYLLKAELPKGSTSYTLVWLEQHLIVKKQLDKETLYVVTDSITGEPSANTKVEFFGYRWDYNEKRWGTPRSKLLTSKFTKTTDSKGQIIVSSPEKDSYNWLATVQHKDSVSTHGFEGIWDSKLYDYEYKQTKTFIITDRPVYKPNDEVKFKLWVRNAQYEMEDTSKYANQRYTVRINDPQGKEIYVKDYVTDSYGGIDASFKLEEEATLGKYYISANYHGGIHFRVEEYKKPEYEVNIELPKDPLELGESFTAKIKAKYYFGTPVTNAKVKYKVYRKDHYQNWYPYSTWDWLYGNGYWWFAYDYEWYPGWHRWGCKAPYYSWYPRSNNPPELLVDTSSEIGSNGELEFTVDTSLAKELFGDRDHKYEVVAEVVDESRRTIVGKGEIIVPHKAFKVYTWLNKGHFDTGETIKASFYAQTPDRKPVEGKGKVELKQITYNEEDEPEEKIVQSWKLDTDSEGKSRLQINALKKGQYRLSYKVTNKNGKESEGAYIFVVMGKEDNGSSFKFNEIEIIPDKREYKVGERVKLRINTNQLNSTVYLFVRPVSGVYRKPEVIKMKGKSTIREITVSKKDMPNFFVEVMTINDGKVHTQLKEIAVPPDKRVLDLNISTDLESYKPGQESKVKIKVTDSFGKPFSGSVVLAVYDKAVEYISGGENTQKIREFFWKWKRHHTPQGTFSINKYIHNMVTRGDSIMQAVGVFGNYIVDQLGNKNERERDGLRKSKEMRSKGQAFGSAPSAASKQMALEESSFEDKKNASKDDFDGGVDEMANLVEATVRKDFADTAYWGATLHTNEEGIAETKFKFPENLTTWKLRAWGLGHGTKVGEVSKEVITTKNLIIRMQAPRFFVEKDEVVLSANVHNYLKEAKDIKVSIKLPDGYFELLGDSDKKIKVDANGEKRVDWRVKVLKEGMADIQMSALTNEESDAVEMKYPVFVHGIDKMESFSGVVSSEQNSSSIDIKIPDQIRKETSRLEIRYSPSVAAAMVDALPYLASYPYGCTEQTLSRFLPTVITQNILKGMGLNLEDIKNKRTNLNAQEIGNDQERSKQWKRFDHNPVFDEAEVLKMVNVGIDRLSKMQVSDGGWGWFSGYGERSYPHTTAYVVHGLQIAKQNGLDFDNNILNRGINWLKSYQEQQITLLKNYEKRKDSYKAKADNLDAFVFMVLADGEYDNPDMRKYLYRDKNHLSIYAKALFGIALHKFKHDKEVKDILRNIEQYLVEDSENQTAYLKLPGSYWWYWYGSEVEANSYYLKLLSLTTDVSKNKIAQGLAKYLINNRKHGTYWNSTRDTAVAIEALATYLKKSNEMVPEMTVSIFIDGKEHKKVNINKENLFTYDNKLVLTADEIKSGKHKIEIKKSGEGNLYFNTYLSYFTLEDYITKAGLEVKVNRKVYKLVKDNKEADFVDSHGLPSKKQVEKYKKVELKNLDTLQSGDLVEVELIIDSKNDYEYLIFEDFKPAGFEAVELQSGYTNNSMGAYVEFRDEKVSFFVRQLGRGKHGLSYRLRAEIPGKFSALPTMGYAMYAPELRANSDEIKFNITD